MIIVTICVRNEEEIIGQCIEHHLSEGAVKIILTDNGSTDNTRYIAEKYKEVEIIDEPNHDYRHGEWVTRMARLAFNRGATWVANIDADEFWSNIKYVYDVKEDVSVIRIAPNYDFLPLKSSKSGEFNQNLMPFWTRSKQRLRLIHRSFPNVIVSDGNHFVMNCPGKEIESDEIIMKHYSIRSYEQFEKKVIKGGTALLKSPQGIDKSTHWRYWYKLYNEGNLRFHYENNICIDDKLYEMKCRILL